MNPILTAGFADQHPGPLKRYSDAYGALVVDCRYQPISRHPEWNKAALDELFFRGPGRYVWAPNLALIGRSTERADLRRATVGIQVLLQWREHFPLILICACHNPDACARGVISLALSRMGIESHELVWPDKPKVMYFAQDPKTSVRQIQEALAEQHQREAQAAAQPKQGVLL